MRGVSFALNWSSSAIISLACASSDDDVSLLGAKSKVDVFQYNATLVA